MPDAVWQPVLYGRTRRVDQWWRVKPRRLPEGWLEGIVQAVVAGGRELAEGPRYLLTADADARLVGVTCRAAELSSAMHSDGGRELYCFVGWLTRNGAESAPVPSLADLERHYVEWARPVYEHWMALDWDRRAQELREPHNPELGDPPWDEIAAPALAQGPSTPREAWPSSDADALWEWGRLARRPHAIATGWRRLPTVPAALSHVAADDVAAPTPLPLPRRPEPEPEPPSRRQPQPEPPGERRRERDPVARGLDAMAGTVAGILGIGRDDDDEARRRGEPLRRDEPPSTPPPPRLIPKRREPEPPPRPREREPVEATTDTRERWDDAWGTFEGEVPATADPPGAVEEHVAAPAPAPEPPAAEAPSPAGSVVGHPVPLADVVDVEGLSLRLVAVRADDRATVDTSPESGVCIVLEGSAALQLGGETQQVTTDTLAAFQGHMMICVVAGSGGVRMLVVQRVAEGP